MIVEVLVGNVDLKRFSFDGEHFIGIDGLSIDRDASLLPIGRSEVYFIRAVSEFAGDFNVT